MEIGDLFASVFTVFKQRFGLLILIMVAPTVLLAVATVVPFLAVIPAISAFTLQDRQAIAALIVVGVVMLLLVLAAPLLQLKAQAMTVAATYEVGQGQRPTFGSLLSSTKGFLPRIFPLVLLLFAAVLVAYGLIFGGVALIAMGSRGGNSEALAAGTVALMILLVIALVPVVLFLSVKLLYVVPVITIEELGPIASLKRSWALTKGAFWRTLGYYLLASLAISALSSMVSGILQIGMVPFMSSMENAQSSAEVLAYLTAMIPLMGFAVLAQSLLQLLTTPFLYVYTSAMYIDQVRRSLLPPAPAPAPWTQPGYPGSPAGYGPPPTNYGPPPAWPQPNTPPPAPPQQQPPTDQPGTPSN